jgi:hypothetical protein
VIRSRSAGPACRSSAELEAGLRANTASIKSPKSCDWGSPRLLARAAKAAFWSGLGQAVRLERRTESILAVDINIVVLYFSDASLSCLQSSSRLCLRMGAFVWSAAPLGESAWHKAPSGGSRGLSVTDQLPGNESGSRRIKADSSLAMGPCRWGMPSAARRGSLVGSPQAGARESPKSGVLGLRAGRARQAPSSSSVA